MSSLTRDRKQALRGAILAKRAALSPARALAWGADIQRSALTLPVYLAARSVALYSPLGNEVETSGIGRDALAAGKRLYYPKVAGGPARVFRVRSGAELVPGRYGIREPAGDQPLPRGEDRELAVFVPGVAFDCRGNRLGRGKGWYDRLLGALDAGARRVALAYEFQVLEEVPAERGDLPVHMIVTEKRVISCCGMDDGAAAGGAWTRARSHVPGR